MKQTLNEFLLKNESVKLFSNKEDASLFYTLISVGNTYTAILMLISEFDKLGWLVLNRTMGIDIKNGGVVLPYSILNRVLNYRLDNCLATISNIPGLNSDYGNYLLTDIFYYDRDTDTVTLRKENELVTKIAIYAGSKKREFRGFLLQFSRNATFSDSLSYILESFILSRFIALSTASNSLKKELMIYNNITLQNYNKLLYTMRVLDQTFDEAIQPPIISRMNLMKLQHNNDYAMFIKTLRTYGKLTPLIDLLDLVEV